MADLYALVPSPPTFQLEPQKGQTREERYVERCLNGFEEPEGIQTTLYQYQFVGVLPEIDQRLHQRSVSRMLQMETRPGRLMDPNYTRLEESTGGTYYVDLSTWDVQRHPGWYQLPRGGIL